MNDHAKELRRFAFVLGKPIIMLDAADEIERLAAKLEAAEKERDALRAKIAEMEKQEPVGWLLDGDFYEVKQMSLYKDNEPLPGQTALYAIPGAQAQPAPSVPMDVIADYLVSISAHLACRDDAKAQAEIRELLKMIAAAPKPEGE